MLAWQYNTIGVSDGITMGSEGMSKSIPKGARSIDSQRHALLSSDP